MSNLAINIENASLSLGGNLILKNFNWQLERGSHHFILGANGAGKTTLVKMIMGLAWPYYGATVEVLGERYGHIDLATMRKRIAWVSPFLQQLTSERELSGAEVVISGVEGTLGLFRKEEPGEREKAFEMLKMLKGEHLMDRPMQVMSSGEQIKLLIARALMSRPELMILDETGVYLDISSREFFLSMVEKLAADRPELTIIFITQRIEDILPMFDCGMIIRKGEVIARGKRDEVLSEDNLRKAFDLNIKLIRNRAGRFWPVIE